MLRFYEGIWSKHIAVSLASYDIYAWNRCVEIVESIHY